MELASNLGGLAAIVAGGFMIFMAFGFTTLGEGDRDALPPAPLIARLIRRVVAEQDVSNLASCIDH